MNPSEFQHWCQTLKLAASTCNVIAAIRAAPPSRRVQGRVSNVSGAYPSRKMGLTIVEMNDQHQQQLQTIRQTVRDAKKVATCLGFGPRFLHSTGQAYKGGPNTGVFLQITCSDAVDLPVSAQKYSFSVVKAAQARGDFQVLAERHR